MPYLRPIKTKTEIPVYEPKHETVDPRFIQQQQQQPGENQMCHYGPDGVRYPNPGVQNMPMYYHPGSVPPPGNMGVQQLPMQAQYVQRYAGGHNHIPVGLHQQVPGMGQVYARERTVNPYDQIRRTPGGVNQQQQEQVYYEVGNAGAIPMYSRMVGPGGEEIQAPVNEPNPGRILQ